MERWKVHGSARAVDTALSDCLAGRTGHVDLSIDLRIVCTAFFADSSAAAATRLTGAPTLFGRTPLTRNTAGGDVLIDELRFTSISVSANKYENCSRV